MIKNLITLFIFGLGADLFAAEDRTLGRSPRGLLMGDAYTSIADDEFSLFYNPALLARHKGFSFYPINPSISATNILSDSDRFSNLGSEPSDFADAAFNFPMHIGVNFSPGFKMGRFGLTAIVNNETKFNLQDKVSPVLDVDYRFDRGFIMGYGHPLWGSYSSDSGGEHLALGASVKYIQRESIFGGYNLTGYTLLDALSQSDIDQILNALGKINGSGWGVDIGVDYVKSSGPNTFTMGLSILDPLTNIQTDNNPDDLEVQDQPMAVNFGSSYSAMVAGGFGFTVSADIRNLQEQMELSRRIHLGFEVALSPALSVLGGLNAVDNYSYGLQLNTGLINLYAGFYGTEIGEKVQQQDSDRVLIYFSLFDFHFDP